jgi:hypothetical protein
MIIVMVDNRGGDCYLALVYILLQLAYLALIKSQSSLAVDAAADRTASVVANVDDNVSHHC